MKSLKTHQRLLLFLIFDFGAHQSLDPLVRSLGRLARMPTAPSLLAERYSFAKIFNRTFMISGILLFFLARRWLGISKPADLGLTSIQRQRSRSRAWLAASRRFDGRRSAPS